MTAHIIGRVIATLILIAGSGLLAVAVLLAWDDVKARESEHRNARRWEDL